MKKFLRVMKVRKEVREQLKVVEYLKAYNSVVGSDDVANATMALDYWLNSKLTQVMLDKN